MPDLAPLMDGMEAVVAEIDVHCECLAEQLLPHDRQHIELNLAAGCARGLQLIAIHQLLLNMQLDRMVLDQLVEAD